MSSLGVFLQPKLDAIKNAGTWRSELIITSPQGAKIRVENGQEVLNFCANNYLGLSNNEEVVKAAKEALDKYGAGLSSVRFICGTQQIHKELEDKLSTFHKREDTILYASCFDANAGIFETLLTPDDVVISDELNHASINDGIKLCKAKILKYKHRDMADLEQKLEQSASSCLKLIASDGICSLDGTVAPLPKILELAKKYKAFTFVDDCHGTGIFGKTGRGTEEYFNVLGSIDIINSSLGKALGGAIGGYTTGPKELIDLLRQRSRPYVYSTSLPPPVVATVIKVLDLISESTEYIERLATNTEHFRSAMTLAGFTISGEGHPICPVMLGDENLASTFAEKMLSRGIYVIALSYPLLPKGEARIRVQINAIHTPEDIDRAIDAFIQIGRELKVIS